MGNVKPKYCRDEAKAYAGEHMIGIWAAVPYPLDADGNLDEPGLRANVRYYIDAGLVDGIFCGQFMSEFWTLTHDERKRAAAVLLEEARGALPVVVHTGHHSARETIELTQHAESEGATYIALGAPYFNAGTEEAIVEYFKSVATTTNLGILIVNTGFSGRILSPTCIAWLAEIDNVVAAKNAAPIAHTLEMMRLCGDRIVISDPDEGSWLMWASKFDSKLFMASPEPYLLQRPGRMQMRDYTARVADGDLSGAAEIAYQMEPARRVYRKWIQAPWVKRGVVPAAYVKVWSELMGQAGGPARPPLDQVSAAERQELAEDLAAVGLHA